MRERKNGFFSGAFTALASLVHGAWIELARVYWPTRQEALQSVALVMLMVSVIGMVLWGFDLLLVRIVAWLTGYGVVA
jgi:preprotein translocase subunit SecE